jgi:hypothetical protein
VIAGFSMVWCEMVDTDIFSPFACNKGAIVGKNNQYETQT